MKKIRIGDEVLWRGGFGNDPEQGAIISGIEHCPDGGKYGDSKQEINAELKNECVFTLTNNHWCYGEQITLLR